MRRYKKGENRDQGNLFPVRLDDQVHQQNSVRAIDAYVNSLDLNKLEFTYTQSMTGKGQPPYDPSGLLKLYLYGYIEHVRSSRRLEKETYRNIEVMWLLDQLHPCYKTIANFRKDNAKALKAVNRDFVLLCRELNLLGGKKVAIDGSFFRGNASKASILTETKLKKHLKKLNAKIEAYQQELDDNDQQEAKETLSGTGHDTQLAEKLEQLKQRQKDKQEQLEQLQAREEKQLSTTDPDARLLSKSGQRVAGYNVQSVVDDKHQLLVESEVTNASNDVDQLFPMANKAMKTLDVKSILALADAGYYEGRHLKQCEDAHITAYVPEPDKSNVIKQQGRYTRAAFTYDESKNIYYCPTGNELTPLGKPSVKNKKMRQRYASNKATCSHCSCKKMCLSEKAQIRQLYRWEHEGVLERHRERMQGSGQEMIQRASLVEHPFGTLKDRAGWTYHFLVRGFKKVSGEWSIMMLGYNFTRVLNILGIDALIAYCNQRQVS
ncbi:MAG: IS1182 family transposase [bacterium]